MSAYGTCARHQMQRTWPAGCVHECTLSAEFESWYAWGYVVAMSTSFEPSHNRAYSEDFRWKMIWQKEALGYTHTKIADNLCIDNSTVSRHWLYFIPLAVSQKGHTQKEEQLESWGPPAQLLILQLCLSRPGIYLREIKDELSLVLEIQASKSVICKFLQKSGFTYLRVKVTALQDAYLRQQYIYIQSLCVLPWNACINR